MRQNLATRIIYSILTYVLLPAAVIRLIIKGYRNKRYFDCFLERFAIYGGKKTKKINRFIDGTHSKNTKILWIHAVSLGESITACLLIKKIFDINSSSALQIKIVLTNTTPTGTEYIKKTFSNDERVMQIYTPYDCGIFIKKFINTFRPHFLIILETELWHNMILECYRKNISVFLVNARISDNSFKQFNKYKFFLNGFFNNVFDGITQIFTQSEKDYEYLRALGADKEKLIKSGNIKFDIKIDDIILNEAADLKRILNAYQKIVWICASTHAGEDDIALSVYKKLKISAANTPSKKNILLIIAPRHPEKLNNVIEIMKKYEVKYAKYSDLINHDGKNKNIDIDVLIVDVIGQMMKFFAASDIAFVGGSMVNAGGHNVLEPALFSIPVIVGPYTNNFTRIMDKMRNQNAITIVKNSDELLETLQKFVNDPKYRKDAGSAANEVFLDNRGTTERIAKFILHICTFYV